MYLCKMSLLCALFFITACGVEKPISIRFTVQQVSEQQVDTLAFFISNPYFVLTDGTTLQASLDESVHWQSSAVSLIKLHCESNNCGETLLLKSPAIERQYISGVGFEIGVPFALNHGNPLLAAAPLNDDSMFWVWQTGHKFLRLDWANKIETVSRGGAFHIGSTGCSAESIMRSPSSECAQPNRLQLDFPEFDLEHNALQFQLAPFIGESQRATLRCTGSYSADAACANVLEKIGLDFNTGQCEPKCNAAQLFSVVSPSIYDSAHE